MPAPWYSETWERGWPPHEPRPPSWNATGAGKHGNLLTQRHLTAQAASVVGGVFRNRWRTLLSVDDAVAAAVAACGTEIDHTFLIFTSDHGFTLGEFGMLMDKRHAYDVDTRVPLLVRGPGIQPRSTLLQMATHVDLAPTVLEMAGLRAQGDGIWRTSKYAMPLPKSTLAQMDGRSLLPLLVATGDKDASTQRPWRTAVLIEHLFWDINVKCVDNCTFDNPEMSSSSAEGRRQAGDPGAKGGAGMWPCGPDKPRRCPLDAERLSYPHGDLWCGNLRERQGCWQTPWSDKPSWHPRPACTQDCYATESEENSFAALRMADGTLYLEGGKRGWRGPSEWAELYASDDEWQIRNLLQPGQGFGELTKDGSEAQVEAQRLATQLAAELRTTWVGCRGDSCP